MKDYVSWTGWLIDGAGGREEEICAALEGALRARDIPKSDIKTVKHNMWWRRDSLKVEIVSTLDSKVRVSVHVQEYGKSLWVGRAVEHNSDWNYFKKMGASALTETIDRCINESLATLTPAGSVRSVLDVTAGSTGS